MSKYHLEVNDTGEIIGADFIGEGAEVPEGFVLPWSDDVLLNVPKYNFSTGDWEEAGTPVEKLNETKDEPQESTEEKVANFEEVIADLKDQLEFQEALLFELAGESPVEERLEKAEQLLQTTTMALTEHVFNQMMGK